MKQVFSSVSFQDEAGNALSNGSLIFSLPTGVYLISSGGGQVIGQSFIINLDATGKITGTVQVWASDEINPQTPYSVVLCAQPNGAQPVGSATWFIGGVSPIDLSLMTPSIGGQPSFVSPVVLNPAGTQTINGQTLNLEGASLGFSASGSTVPDSFFSRLAAGVIGVGTAIGNALGTLRTAILQIGGSDTGISRASAGVIDVGNGMQGDASGTINCSTLNVSNLGVSSLTIGNLIGPVSNPVTVRGGSGSSVGLVVKNVANTANLVSFPDTGGVQVSGSTSGAISVVAPAVAGSATLTLPSTTGNIVSDSATQTLTAKRITIRASSVASATSITPNSDTSDLVTQVNTGSAGTLTLNAPTGTPTEGQKLTIRIKSTNAQTYSFNAAYKFSTTVTAPITLAASKTDYIGCMWNATNSVWDVVAVDQGH